MSDSDLERFNEERKADRGLIKRITRKLTPLHIGIIVLMAFLANMYFRDNETSPTVKWIVILAIGVLILFLLRNDDKKELIPFHIAKKLAYNDFMREVGKGGSYPEGTNINPLPYGYLRKVDNGDGGGFQPFQWDVGFKVKEPNNPEREIVVKVHPYTGLVYGRKEEIFYDGTKSKDIQYVFPETFVVKEQAQPVKP